MKRGVGALARIALGLAVGHASAAAADDAAGPPDGHTTGAGSGWSVRRSSSAADYRLALAHHGIDVGLRLDRPAGVGLTPESQRRDPALSGPLLQAPPAIEFGLQDTRRERAALRDVAAPDGGASSRRVALQWKPASQLLFFRQGVGLRLSGDDRVTMRLRRGVVGLYMKQEF